jgi:hypothetical protein
MLLVIVQVAMPSKAGCKDGSWQWQPCVRVPSVIFCNVPRGADSICAQVWDMAVQ